MSKYSDLNGDNIMNHKDIIRLNNDQMTNNELEFSIFCIENLAIKLAITGQEVYDLLTKRSDILDEYIIPNYDILHTQSKEYIENDIIDYMKEYGVME